MLEEERYLGKGDYPQIILQTEFNAAQGVRKVRKQYKPNKEPLCLKLIEDKLSCMQCGSLLTKGKDVYDRVSEANVF